MRQPNVANPEIGYCVNLFFFKSLLTLTIFHDSVSMFSILKCRNLLFSSHRFLMTYQKKNNLHFLRRAGWIFFLFLYTLEYRFGLLLSFFPSLERGKWVLSLNVTLEKLLKFAGPHSTHVLELINSKKGQDLCSHLTLGFQSQI